MTDISNLAFLGVCERVQRVTQGHPVLHKYNIIGLKNPIASHVYPFNLEGLQLAFAIRHPESFFSGKIRGILPDGKELFYINLKFATEILDEPLKPPQVLDSISRKHHVIDLVVPIQGPAWIFLTIPIPPRVILHEPVPVTLIASSNESEEIVGQIGFTYVQAAPLSSDRIEAIRSSPNAAKWVRILIQCNQCSDRLKTYTGLERGTNIETEGWVWCKDLPDRFRCKCGANDINLHYIRESLHGLLGNIQRDDGQIEFHRLYERGVLETISSEYWRLLKTEPREEAIQKFIEENPVILQYFSPERVFHKTPILTKYKTDFTILDNRGHLLLIEIERADIRLLKKDGSIAADLEHAITQVNDWLHTFDQYRQACFECVGISPKDVVQVSGVIIAGRDDRYGKENLSRLKWRDFGRVAFFTYDDIGRSLDGLLRRFSQL